MWRPRWELNVQKYDHNRIEDVYSILDRITAAHAIDRLKPLCTEFFDIFHIGTVTDKN